jgi:hypothetical protein
LVPIIIVLLQLSSTRYNISSILLAASLRTSPWPQVGCFRSIQIRSDPALSITKRSHPSRSFRIDLE